MIYPSTSRKTTYTFGQIVEVGDVRLKLTRPIIQNKCSIVKHQGIHSVHCVHGVSSLGL